MRKTSVVLFAIALALGAGVAVASIPDADGTIHGCRNLTNGALRVIGGRRHCRDYEKPLNWSVRGPQGPVGPQGPPGAQGEPGPALESFDALAGLACTVGSQTGAIAIEYDATTGDARIRCVLPAAPPAQIRLNEFSTGVEGALTDEFVEVVNAGAETADVGGYRLVYRSAAGTSDIALAAVPEGTTLAPGDFLLFGGAGYAGARTADLRFTAAIASAGGGLGLRDPQGALVDSVGWGTATNAFVETTAAVAPAITPAPGRSDARHPDGHDGDDNLADFTEGEPTPGLTN